MINKPKNCTKCPFKITRLVNLEQPYAIMCSNYPIENEPTKFKVIDYFYCKEPKITPIPNWCKL